MKFLFLLASAAFFAGAEAHMLLSKPQMFPNQGATTPFNNGPLNNGGAGDSNYPCKATGPSSWDFSFARTQLAPGSNFTMSMMGSAVHGGGSCQVSLTKDLQPTKDSIWKVIHSVEGGCPARDTSGNLSPSSAQNADPFTYSFIVPEDLEAGKYTYAWSWANKIGNREFYMNCAPVEVGGSTKRDVEPRASSYFDSLPNMFIANIPESDCTTADSTDLKYPAPGESVERNNPSDKLVAPVLKSGGDMDKCYAGFKGPGSSASGTPSAPSNSKSGSGAGSGAGASPSAATPVAPAPVAAPSSAAPAAPVPQVPTSISSMVPAAAAPSAAPSTGSGACPSGQQPCTHPGALFCVGSTQFGICDLNNCMMPQSVALGTHCTGNQITARAVPPQGRRDVLAS